MRTSLLNLASVSVITLLAACNLNWGPTTSCPKEPEPCEMTCGGNSQNSCGESTCTPTCDDGSGNSTADCLDYYAAAAEICASVNLAPVVVCDQNETGVTHFEASCGLDTDGDGDGDVYVYVDVTAEAEANASSEGGGSGGDDTDGGTDTDDTGEPMTDEWGFQGCQLTYNTDVESWLTAHGSIPAELYCNDDVQCDRDRDGVMDTWTSVVYVKSPEILDFAEDELSLLAVSGWYCSNWGDLTPDPDSNEEDHGATDDSQSEDEGDCDENSGDNYDGALQICGGGFDNDCDGQIDETCATDEDGDGYSELTGDCNDLASSIGPGIYEYSDGVDNDCDGTTDELNTIDGDGDGITEVGGDCDDGNTSVFPGATEYCNNADDDCDGTIDEVDSDGDGYTGCSAYDGSTLLPDDCNDSDAAINPGEVEIVNWMDDDCDSTADAECTTVDYDNYYAGSDPEVCDGV